jgi:hypothetical protein
MKQFFLIKRPYFRNLFLIGFYTLFFFVELFHNFDCFKTINLGSFEFAVGRQSPLHAGSSKCKAGGSSPKINFRLNKRFQPSFVPSRFVVAPQVHIEYAERNYCGRYSSEPLSNIFLLTKSLRAPPVV